MTRYLGARHLHVPRRAPGGAGLELPRVGAQRRARFRGGLFGDLNGLPRPMQRDCDRRVGVLHSAAD